MKKLMFAAVPALVMGLAFAITSTSETKVVQDLGKALNPNDPTNGGFWSLDWTDEQGVRHTHPGVTVSEGTSTAEGDVLVGTTWSVDCSDPIPLVERFGMLLIFR